MKINKNLKGWLYLLPAFLFIAVFMIYPLIDVFIYSFEEGFNFASGESFGVGIYKNVNEGVYHKHRNKEKCGQQI